MCACSSVVAEVEILGHRRTGILLGISVSSLGKRAGTVACVLVLQQWQAGIPVDSHAVGRQAGGVCWLQGLWLATAFASTTAVVWGLGRGGLPDRRCSITQS